MGVEVPAPPRADAKRDGPEERGGGEVLLSVWPEIADCPICKTPMLGGRIWAVARGRSGTLGWEGAEANGDLHMGKHIVLSSVPLAQDSPRFPAFRCPNCRVVLLNYSPAWR